MREGPTIQEFFKPVGCGWLWGTLLFGLAFVFNSHMRQDFKDKELSYKQGVFAGASGQKMSLDAKFGEYFMQGHSVGVYLRDAKETGITVSTSLQYLSRAHEIVKGGSAAFSAEGFMLYLKKVYDISDNTPLSIFNAAQNMHMYTFTEEEQKMLELAAAGEGTAPAWYADYDVVPPWAGWYVFFSVVQSVAFIFYFLYSIDIDRERPNFMWYRLPWGIWWPYVGILFLLPGAMPLIFFFTLLLGASWIPAGIRALQVRRQKNIALDDTLLFEARERLERTQQRLRSGRVS